MTNRTSAETEPSAAPRVSWGRLQRNYVLLILCLSAAFSAIDRQIINVVLQPIKEEFHASDTAMGLLTGLIFAGFYAAGSIPIARLSDRYPRKLVLTLCLGFWSVMTSVGGIAQNFWQLAASRVGVAVAEAGAVPASHSMIADLYRRNFRATAIAVLSAASSVGIGLGVYLGGTLSEAFGWRVSFMLVGLPGLLLAGVMFLTVREPPRGMSDDKVDTSVAPNFGRAMKVLMAIPSYPWLVLTVGLAGFTGYGFLGWGPTFLIRVHHMSPTNVGVWFGGAVASSLVIGNLLGGLLGDALGKRDIRAYLWVGGAGPLLSIPAALVFVTASDWRVAIAGLFAFTLLLTTHIPTCYAMGQTIVPLRVRATASVLMTLASSLTGTGLAPVIIGAANDLLAHSYGDQAIRYSLAGVSLSAGAAAVTAFIGSIWIRRDYAKAHAAAAEPADVT